MMLEKELSDSCLNRLNKSIIILNSNTKLSGFYVAKTDTSIIFPYYLSSTTGEDYSILIFSKEYFIVKNKFRELNKIEKRKKNQ